MRILETFTARCVSHVRYWGPESGRKCWVPASSRTSLQPSCVAEVEEKQVSLLPHQYSRDHQVPSAMLGVCPEPKGLWSLTGNQLPLHGMKKPSNPTADRAEAPGLTVLFTWYRKCMENLESKGRTGLLRGCQCCRRAGGRCVLGQ